MLIAQGVNRVLTVCSQCGHSVKCTGCQQGVNRVLTECKQGNNSRGCQQRKLTVLTTQGVNNVNSALTGC